MLLPASYFPNAIIFPLPVFTDPLYVFNDVLPSGKGNRLYMFVSQVEGIQKLPVYVELELVIGAVANSEGS